MKALVFISLFLLFCFLAYTVDIPEVLQKLGFTQNHLLSYEEQGLEQFFTFDNITSDDLEDTITFIIEDGKIKQTINGQTARFWEKGS